jgi:hypothetical protein
MKHKPVTTIHAVPFGSATPTADCGERLGNGHTGHFRPLVASIPGWHVCAACNGVTR